MSVALYDKIVKDKIAGWVVDPNMTVYGPDETSRLFRHQADVNGDKPISLPLIAISRDRDLEIVMTAKHPLAYMGKTFNATFDAADHLNAVPCRIGYQIDIYTRYQAEADEYVRNFVFNIINFPAMTLEIPYNDSKNVYTSYLTLLSPIRDNSDIQERLIPGQFTRMTISVRLNDAQLFSYNHKLIPKITRIEIEPKLKYNIEFDINTDINVQWSNMLKFPNENSGVFGKKVSVEILDEDSEEGVEIQPTKISKTKSSKKK